MSVLDYDKIDAIAEDKDQNVVLLLADHLDWEREYEHLKILQNKVNAYIQFVESGQIWEIRPKCKGNKVIFDIRFKHSVTTNCLKLINNITEVVKPLNIELCITNTGE